MDNSFLFIGGDRRIRYAAEYIAKFHQVSSLGLDDSPKPCGKFRFIVLPLPFSRDGICVNAPLSPEAIPLDTFTGYATEDAVVFAGGSSMLLEGLCKEHNLTLADYFSDEPLTLKNAALTAEGAIALLIDNTEYSLSGARVLITGYGRIAAYTARLLKCFGADVTVAARRAEQRTKAQLDGYAAVDLGGLSDAAAGSDIIINTVPSALFQPEDFRRMQQGTLYMELATRKAFPECDYAAAASVRYLPAAGLPGKLSPKTAGETIAQTILEYINKLNNSE